MSNDFLQWNPTKANQESDVDWLNDAQRLAGAANPSIFPSERANKLFYQLSTFMAAFGEMLSDKGYTVSDADITVLESVLANVLTMADVYNTDTGAANAYAVAVNSVVGKPVYFIAANSSTGASTLTTNTVTASIKNIADEIGAGDIQAGQVVGVVYDGTNYQLISGAGNYQQFSRRMAHFFGGR